MLRLRQEEENARRRLSALTEEFTQAESARKAQLSDAERNLDAILSKKRAETEETEEVLRGHRKDLDGLRDQLASLNRTLLDDVKQSDEHRAKLLAAEREAQAALDKKKAELQATVGAVSSRRKDLDLLRGQLRDLQHSLEKTRSEITSANAKHESDESEARQRWAELETNMRQANDEHQKRIIDMEQTEAAKNLAIKSTESHLNQAQAALAQERSALDDLHAQRVEASQSAELAATERAETAERHRVEEEEARERLSTLHEEAKTAHAHRMELITAERAAAADLEKKQKMLATAQRAIEAKRKELQDLRGQLSTLTRSLEQAQLHLSTTSEGQEREEANARSRLSQLLEGVQRAEAEFSTRQRNIAEQEEQEREHFQRVRNDIAAAQRAAQDELLQHQQEASVALQELAQAREDLSVVNAQLMDQRRLVTRIQADISRDDRRLAAARDAVKVARAREHEAQEDCEGLELAATELTKLLQQAKVELQNVRHAQAQAASSLEAMTREAATKAAELAALDRLPRTDTGMQTDYVEDGVTVVQDGFGML
jgi:chromosome segregation ATPase